MEPNADVSHPPLAKVGLLEEKNQCPLALCVANGSHRVVCTIVGQLTVHESLYVPGPVDV